MSNNNEEDDLLYGDIVTSQGEDGRESLRVTRDRLEKSERHHAKRIEQLEAKSQTVGNRKRTDNERMGFNAKHIELIRYGETRIEKERRDVARREDEEF